MRQSMRDTTTKPAAAEASPNGGGGGWIFPNAFSSRERDQADVMLRDVGDALGQALLDELAGRLEQGALRGAPLDDSGNFALVGSGETAQGEKVRIKLYGNVNTGEVSFEEVNVAGNN